VAADKLAKSCMKKTNVSSTDLIWMIHQRLLLFEDFPQQGRVSLAIVPARKNGWTVVVGRRTGLLRTRHWQGRIKAIERELQATFALKP
jgi:hypothetical protein